MDVLSDVVRVVHLSGAVFFRAEFSAPWALESPNPELTASIVLPDAECLVLFHILTEGECLVESHGRMTRLEAGDVIVFPHGEPHTIRSDVQAACTPMKAVFSPGRQDELLQVSFGGGGQKARFICGYLNCDQRFQPLITALPTMLVVRSRDDYTSIEATGCEGQGSAAIPQGSGTWLGTTLKFTVNEARNGRPGNAAMLGRLTELMFVELVREYMQQLPGGQVGWLAGLKDAHVGPALRLLHTRPTHKWTVGELARGVALSRSALAQRFTRVIGEAPMRYLARWRIQLAKQLIRQGHSIQVVAARVGYESESAFNRTFKRLVGVPPAAWRKSALNACTLWTVLGTGSEIGVAVADLVPL